MHLVNCQSWHPFRLSELTTVVFRAILNLEDAMLPVNYRTGQWKLSELHKNWKMLCSLSTVRVDYHNFQDSQNPVNCRSQAFRDIKILSTVRFDIFPSTVAFRATKILSTARVDIPVLSIVAFRATKILWTVWAKFLTTVGVDNSSFQS